MNEQLLQKIVNCPRLPSLPAAALAVLDLCQRDDVGITEIAQTISRDPALTARILKTVNSGYYSLNHSVTSVSHAMVLLGINTVKTLALGFTLVNNMRDLGVDFDAQVIWRRSLYAAAGSRAVAEKIGGIDKEEAFLGGLLQDLGVLALLQALGAPYAKLLESTGPSLSKLADLENAALKLDHCKVGVGLCEKWQLPRVLIEPIRYHESPDQYPGGTPTPMVAAVALGNFVAQLYMTPSGEDADRERVDAYYRGAKAWAGLDDEAASDLLKTVGEGAPTMLRHFDLPEGFTPAPHELVAQAQEILTELTLQTQMQAQAAIEKAEELKVRATRDSLTGARNRGEFDRHLADIFVRAQEAGRAFSLVLVDLDRFKLVNDTHGHQAGDQVLCQVAGILQSAEEQGALVARYGGEEFVLILDGASSQAALALAEGLRAKIEASPVMLPAGPALRVTASFGIGVYGEKLRFAEAAEVLKAADAALYRAKSEGRNTVCLSASEAGDAPGESASQGAA
jgi:diguanylate cyclase (GGDEF)-like protein